MLAADVDWYLPDRSPGQDRHRDDGEFAGGTIAVSRSPAGGVRRHDCRAAFKVKGWTSKYILKKAIADLVPAENLHRPKQGFAVPIGAWFRGELKEMLADHLLSPRFAQRGLFEPRVVQRLFDDHQQGRATTRIISGCCSCSSSGSAATSTARRRSSARSLSRRDVRLVLSGRDIICISSIDWDFIWQGHQEIMSSLVGGRQPRAVRREHRRPRAGRPRSAARAAARRATGGAAPRGSAR